MPSLTWLATPALLAGACLSLVAALLHVACIFWGADGFRFLGAGEALARMAERGHWYPKVVAGMIAAVLTVWAAYAVSAVGLLPRLPMLRLVLSLITMIYLGRALGYPLLRRVFPENSTLFWRVTSAICLIPGILHLVGLLGLWEVL